MNRKQLTLCGVSFVMSCGSIISGQDSAGASIHPSEAGAAGFYFSAGTSFGYPADQAFVVTSQGSIVSPKKTALPNVGLGATVRAWRFVVPFVDFNVIDAGKATAQIGSLQAQIQDKNTFLANGGARLIGSKSRIRPYVQFGGGMLYTSATSTFTIGNQVTTTTQSNSAASAMYGGGLQLFYGRRWGSEIGFDAFHINKQLSTGGQNFSRLYVTLFLQTKSAIQ